MNFSLPEDMAAQKGNYYIVDVEITAQKTATATSFSCWGSNTCHSHFSDEGGLLRGGGYMDSLL